MGISLYGIGFGASAYKSMGQVWKPKSQKLSVGREIAPISATVFGREERNVVAADGDDTRFMSREIYAAAKDAAKRGWAVKNFRAVDTKEITFSTTEEMKLRSITVGSSEEAAMKAQLSRENATVVRDSNAAIRAPKNRAVTFDGTTLTVYETDEEGKALRVLGSQTVTQDTRLSWDENNDPVFSTGVAARSADGKLEAKGDMDVLIRKSKADVKAGGASTVINLSAEKGTFSGGHDVTYLGSYSGSAITGGTGQTTYAGYFENMESMTTEGKGVFSGVFENTIIDSGHAGDKFSGYFSGATVNGGKGKNSFKGIFLNGSTLNGSDDGNTFYGRFIDSMVNGGAGDDSFGAQIDLNGQGMVAKANGDMYKGLMADFIDSDVDAGEGNDMFSSVVWGGTVDMGGGNDTVTGMFSQANVFTGDGDDVVRTMFNDSSVFDLGAGANAAHLATAVGSSVAAGEDKNTITMGHTLGESTMETGSTFGGDLALAGTTWQTMSLYKNNIAGMVYGELAGNSIDASVGENVVRVFNGVGTETAFIDDVTAPGLADEEEEENAGDVTESVSVPEIAYDAMLQELSLIDGSDLPSLSHADPADGQGGSGSEKQRGRVIGRYARRSDDFPVRGSTGVTVSTGTGDPMQFETFDRSYAKDDSVKSWIYRATRTNTGFGTYTWNKGLV